MHPFLEGGQLKKCLVHYEMSLQAIRRLVMLVLCLYVAVRKNIVIEWLLVAALIFRKSDCLLHVSCNAESGVTEAKKDVTTWMLVRYGTHACRSETGTVHTHNMHRQYAVDVVNETCTVVGALYSTHLVWQYTTFVWATGTTRWYENIYHVHKWRHHMIQYAHTGLYPLRLVYLLAGVCRGSARKMFRDWPRESTQYLLRDWPRVLMTSYSIFQTIIFVANR